MSDAISLVPREPGPEPTHASEDQSPSSAAPLIATSLVVLNVLLFLIPGLSSFQWFAKPTVQQLLAWGANFGPLTLHGQWWRLITACFVHIGIIHIAMNMFILLQAGNFAEAVYGRVRFLLIYLLAGIGGNLASAMREPPIVSAGASGAIFGIYGSILAFVLMQRRTVSKGMPVHIGGGAGVFIFYNLIYSLVNPSVDIRAHLGGLLTGFLVALPLARPLVPGQQPALLVRSGLVAVGAVAVVAGVLSTHSFNLSPKDELQRKLLAGKVFVVGKNDKIFYSGLSTEEDARKLGAVLVAMKYFAGKGGVLLLSKGEDGTTVFLITRDRDPSKPGDGSPSQPDRGPHLVPNVWDNPDFLASVRALGIQIAPALGGPPMKMALLTSDGVVEKVIRIDMSAATFGLRDGIWYSDQVSLDDVNSLGGALRKEGWFRDLGALVVLSRQNGTLDVSLVMSNQAWDDPNLVVFLQALSKKISQDIGKPIQMHIVDKTITKKKDI